ncbi:MAG: membrane-binding protein, partial [Bacteroidota bacterium]
MKSFLRTLLWLPLLWISCSETPRKLQTEDPAAAVSEVPNITIEIAALEYHAQTSLWTLNDIPFSGFALSYHKDGGLQEKFGILNGKKQGKHVRFYADGHFKSVAEYNGGKL